MVATSTLSKASMKKKDYRICHEHGRGKDLVSGKSGRQSARCDAMFDLLVLVHGENLDCEEYILSKLYEYLWTQRPILGIV